MRLRLSLAALLAGCAGAPPTKPEPTLPKPEPAPVAVSTAAAQAPALAGPPEPAAEQDPLELVDEARKFLKSGDYEWALATLKRAIRAEPGLALLAPGEMARRIESMIADLGLDGRSPRRGSYADSAGAAGKAARAAIEAFVDGRDVEATLEAAVAVGEEPQSEAYRLLLGAVSRRTGLQVPREELLPRAALVQLKLQRAEHAVGERRFGEAARECQEAVWLNPKNALAWTRLGSTRWASGEPERARAAFEQALALDPENAEVREFMRAKGLAGRGRTAAGAQ